MIYRNLLIALGVVGASANLHTREWYETRFFDWMAEHGIKIEDGAEFVHRLQIFSNNHDLIESHNAANTSYELGHNEFSHLTFEEFRQRMNLGYGMPKRLFKSSDVHTAVGDAPASVDWVSSGAVTGVKDQGQCGSCWSFSTTGCLEGAYQIKTGELVSFSEQMLVDCDHTDFGCHGGLMDNAFAWVQKNGGLCTEQAYPYTSGTTKKAGTCAKSACSVVAGSGVTGWTDVAQNEDALLTAVAQQPVSVAIEADQLGFQFYKSGVFTGTCGTNLDHGVLAVGYGVWSDGTPYWKVKNSWGTSWGMGGYILLERGKNQEGGQCGIALSASYATL